MPREFAEQLYTQNSTGLTLGLSHNMDTIWCKITVIKLVDRSSTKEYNFIHSGKMNNNGAVTVCSMG